MRRYTTDPGTAGIAFLSPLPAELTLRIKEPIVLLRIVGLATPDSPDTSMRPSNADESQYSTVIAIVTQSGKFYYTYNNSPEICAVALKAPALPSLSAQDLPIFRSYFWAEWDMLQW